MQATSVGMKEITGPVIAMTITLAAVLRGAQALVFAPPSLPGAGGGLPIRDMGRRSACSPAAAPNSPALLSERRTLFVVPMFYTFISRKELVRQEIKPVPVVRPSH